MAPQVEYHPNFRSMALYSGINLFLIGLMTRIVPRPLYRLPALATAVLVYALMPEKRRAVRSNLRSVTGRDDVERLLFSTFFKYALNWCDVMLMMRLKGAVLQGLIGRRSTQKPLDDALSAGTGAILVSPHLGNWELGGLGLADFGYPVNVMTFREPDEKVNELREQVRSERGIGFIYVDRDDTSPLAIIEAVNALRRNEILCLLGDRDGSYNTVNIDFFGRQAALPAGAAYLSIASGAPVIPVFVVLEGSRYATLMDDPIVFNGAHGKNHSSIREGMEKLVTVFEKYIHEYPDQWYNFYDFWNTRTKE